MRARPGDGAPGRLLAGPWIAVFAVLLAILLVRSLLGLASSPPGLYVDEASVGYNAWAVGHHGRDEHGTSWPLYFEAFGEWKNPVYIYVLAAILRVLPLTVYTTRLPAALFGITAALAITATAWLLTRSRGLTAMTMLITLVTPWLVLQSRLGFEASALVACLAVALLCLVIADATRSTWAALGAGVALALGVFAYSTGRVEIALLTVAVAVTFTWWWRHPLEWLPVFIPVAFAYLVLGLWVHAHPGALTQRFDLISIGADHPPFDVLAGRFVRNYSTYFDTSFLFTTGDSNLRHNTQFLGMLPLTTAPFVLLGLAGLWTRRCEALARFVAAGLLLAPASAALTQDGTPHSLRDNDALPFLLLTVVYGLRLVWPWLVRPPVWAALVAAAFCIEGTLYTDDLFARYPARSAAWFDAGDLQGIEDAVAAAHGHDVVLSSSLDQPYIEACFALTPPPPPQEHTVDVGGTVLPPLHVYLASELQDPTAPLPSGDIVVLAQSDPVPANATLVAAERPPGGGTALVDVYRIG